MWTQALHVSVTYSAVLSYKKFSPETVQWPELELRIVWTQALHVLVTCLLVIML